MSSPAQAATTAGQWAARLERLLSGLVLLFAFLAASIPAYNSDLWQHLASGRLLAQGESALGIDAFAYTSQGAYWVNHSWLYDLSIYLLWRLLGGPGLVLLKALAVTALAWLMLRIRQAGTGSLVPAACTLLALVALSPRLLLQPACLSYVFLGATLWLLWQPYADLVPNLSTFRSQWWRFGPLLVLFVIWANSDTWFLLGPLLVALFWLGERGRSHDQRTTPGWLVVGGLAACLINPHFHRVFTLPAELSPAIWTGPLVNDPRFMTRFLSPWQIREYLLPGATATVNLAGLAYFILVGLGVISFVLVRQSLVGWRLVVWGVFALLGAWQVRLIPFFAVLAGPITALNLQDAMATRGSRAKEGWRWRFGLTALRLSLVGTGLALVVLAWTGWLLGRPSDGRRVGWDIRPDPSLTRVAHTLQQWRQQGLLRPDERVFATHPDVAHYCAWFAPEERGFLDQRLTLLASVLPEFEAICQGLALAPEALQSPLNWHEVLRKHGITVIVLHDPDLTRLFPAVRRLSQAPEQWSLLRIDGRVAVFGWKPGRQHVSDSFARLQLNLRRLAFGPAQDDILPAAPGPGPTWSPRAPSLWDAFRRPASPIAWESDAATLYLRLFEDRIPLERHLALAYYAAGVAGVAAGVAPQTLNNVLVRLLEAESFLPGFRIRPPMLPLLAIRAARCALANNPDDANAWLRLGQAYLLLDRTTGERSGAGDSTLLGQLRHIQAATALENALLINPDLAPAHEALSVLYGERSFLDAALLHRREAVRLTSRAYPGEGDDDFTARLLAEEEALGRLERLVQDRRNEFAVRSRAFSGDPLGRARLALQLGLARSALDDVLLRSQVQIFGGEGARLQLELMLMLGRAEAVREALDDPEMQDHRSKLSLAEVAAPSRSGYLTLHRLPAYEWFRFLQAAATGNYDLAAETLEQLLRPLDATFQRGLKQLRYALPLTVATEIGVATQPANVLPCLIVRGEARQLLHHLADHLFLAAQRADLNVLGALLALEQGNATVALRALDAAFAAARDRGTAPEFATQRLASAYRRRLQ